MVNRRKIHDNLALGLIMLAALLAGIAATGTDREPGSNALAGEDTGFSAQAAQGCERPARDLALAGDSGAIARTVDSGRGLVAGGEHRKEL